MRSCHTTASAVGPAPACWRRHTPWLLTALGAFAALAAAGHHPHLWLLFPLLGALIDDEALGPDSQLLDEQGVTVLRAVVRLKKAGGRIRQSDIAHEAGIGERTLASHKAASPALARLIDDAILFCLDQHLLTTARRLQAEGGPVNYARIATEACVAVTTLRRRRQANAALRNALDDAVSSTFPSDLKILAAVRQLRPSRAPLTYADVAREAGVNPSTLRARLYANHQLRDAVNAIVLSTDTRILTAIRTLHARGAELDQKTVAAEAGLDAATVTSRKKHSAVVRTALDDAVKSSDRRILTAVRRLIENDEHITQRRIAEVAGVAERTVTLRKERNPDVREAVENAVSTCMRRRVAAAVQRLDNQGAPVTQRAIAEQLGMSEAAIVYHKERNPDTFELIEDALELSAAERIREAKTELLSEDIPCTRRNLAQRAGVDTSTVSRLISTNSDLAKGVVSAAPRLPIFPSAAACRDALAARVRVHGDETCNAASSLRQPRLRGGNPTLLRACRRFGVRLPLARRDALTGARADRMLEPAPRALVTFLKRMENTESLPEDEAVALWRKTRDGDPEATEALLVRTRPLVKFVIENSLHETIDPFGFKVELLRHLISEGDLLLVTTWEDWDGRGRLLWFLHRQLRDGLRRARMQYYKERTRKARQEISIDETLAGSDEPTAATLDPGRTQALAAKAIPPDALVAILNDTSGFGTEELVARRDADSGVPVLSRYDKQSLAAALGTVFAAPAFGRTLAGTRGTQWALFMVGELGRMGTAIVGHAGFRGLILSNASAGLLRRAATSLAAKLSASSHATSEELPALIIGDARDYDRVMDLVRTSDRQWEMLRRLVLCLQRAGIGLAPEAGIADLRFAPLENGVTHCTLFELLKNGILVAESAPGARSTLMRDAMAHMPSQTPEDAGRALLDAQVSFLQGQRAILDRVRARTSSPVERASCPSPSIRGRAGDRRGVEPTRD